MKISHLYIYPIKSCMAISVEALVLDELGAVNDRRYMLVDARGCFVTLREYPQLMRIRIVSAADGWLVTVPGAAPQLLLFQGDMSQQASVQVWNDSVDVYDQGEVWSRLFSRFLNFAVRLVYIHGSVRRVDRHYSPIKRFVSFADGFPLLITNLSTLDAFNQGRLKPVEMLRFRPNIVVSGAAANAEIEWKAIQAGLITLDVVKPCSRCVIPAINLQTYEKEPDVVNALARLMRAADGKVYFGQNAIHRQHGCLRVGDSVAVI